MSEQTLTSNRFARTQNITRTDASVQCGLLWSLHEVADEAREIVESTGVADSPTARRMQVVLAAHAESGQPLADRLAAYCVIARGIATRLSPPRDAAARSRRAVLGAVHEHVLAVVRSGVVPELEHNALRRRVEATDDWGDHPELVAASVLLGAASSAVAEAMHAWCWSAELLAELARVVRADELLEDVMSDCARDVYAHLWSAA